MIETEESIRYRHVLEQLLDAHKSGCDLGTDLLRQAHEAIQDVVNPNL